ncbi:toll-like receptor 4 [Ostrea edulis]|uniref:toll-like receptor 4 n=1 Tax=Ostrea edulis TaxID=37623 RepID=UPI0024AEC9A7|nr:toll-like receptor 4 [Ostrea edulis]
MLKFLEVLPFYTVFIWFTASQILAELNCTTTCNSTDVIVTCNGSSTPIPQNVTILHIHNYSRTLDSLCKKRGYEKLRILDVSKNKLEKITQGCFSTFPSLEILIISNNEQLGFSNFYNACYGLNATQIKEIYANDINQKMVNYPFPKNISLVLQNTSLQTLHIEYNEIRIAEIGAIYYLPQTLRNISVRGNRLETNTRFFEMLHLNKLLRLDISYQCTSRKFRSRSRRHVRFVTGDSKNHTGIECYDTRESDVLRILPNSLRELIATGAVSGSSCIPFLSTQNHSTLEYIDISRAGYDRWIGPINDTESSIKTLILSYNQCYYIKDGFFNNLKNLTTLDISFNYLYIFFRRSKKSNVFQGLPSLKSLSLSYNRLSKLPENLLKNNLNLERLNISNNALETWTVDISHLKQLTYIDCSSNKLAKLPKSVRDSLDEASHFQNVTLDFHQNKILCTCDNLDFINWLFTSKVNILLAKKDECTIYNGNISQAHRHLNEECGRNNGGKEWLYPVQFIGILFILSVLAVVGYKKRWAIIYRWYLIRLQRKGYTPIGGTEDSYEYDAFLSFADEDRSFVDKVIEELEKNPDTQFKVCVHYRDFTPGKSISRNIVSAVHSSRKTIVFMSRAYLKSHWCKHELCMAMTEENHMDRKVIIMTVLEDIPKKELSLDVLHYFKKKSYIAKPNNEQEMKLFWKTLKGVVANDL